VIVLPAAIQKWGTKAAKQGLQESEVVKVVRTRVTMVKRGASKVHATLPAVTGQSCRRRCKKRTGIAPRKCAGSG
jgi:hypothetical protein